MVYPGGSTVSSLPSVAESLQAEQKPVQQKPVPSSANSTLGERLVSAGRYNCGAIEMELSAVRLSLFWMLDGVEADGMIADELFGPVASWRDVVVQKPDSTEVNPVAECHRGGVPSVHFNS